jgi:NAD(P)-dependent dehydrogenase (short-subunit alcohol dehydrogenase family)
MRSLTRRRFAQGSLLAALASAVSNAYGSSVPKSSFGPLATGEEVTAGLNLTGKTAVVTGCNSGIGYEVMRVLALRGAHVIGTARTAEKGREACRSVKGKATPVVLELTDFDSVVACASSIAQLTPRVDMLICNAGIVLGKLEQVRGLEKQFVVNHLGHFILTNRLLDRVVAAPQGRVVVVGSRDHRRTPPPGIQFDQLSGEGWHQNGYAHSKLANGLFSLELSKRLKGTKATSNCATPGHIRTNILRNVETQYMSSARTPAQGSATICYVATNPALAGVSGEFFKDCNPAEQSAYHKDEAMAARLWKVSEELTREFLA